VHLATSARGASGVAATREASRVEHEEEEEDVLTNEQPWEVAATRWIHAARAARMGEGLRGGEGMRR